MEVRCGNRLFIVDAGTGLSALGAELGASAPDEVDILLSHLHLDHIAGLPFFKPAISGAERVIRTYLGNLDGASAEEPLTRLFSPPLFPISLDQLSARFEHNGFKAGETLHFADGPAIRTHPLNHPGGATGYRIQHRGRTVCYVSDLEHDFPWPNPELAAFVHGADLVIYDGMFSDTEYPRCRGWGHSTWQKGVELCQASAVRELAIFHLHPTHDDAYLRAVEAEMRKAMPTAFVARERQLVSLPPAGSDEMLAVASGEVKLHAT